VKKIEGKARKLILNLHSQGKINATIAKESGFSKVAIGNFLRKQGLVPNRKSTDRSRPCKICGKVFTPKYSDGVEKDKYTTCSTECSHKAISLSKIKYTQKDILRVVDLKKDCVTNKDISKQTGVNINKIKEIVKNNQLFLTSEQAQKNAYKNKLKKNPDCMEHMRKNKPRFHHAEFNQKIDKVIQHLEDKNDHHSIPTLCKKYNVSYGSVRGSLHTRGLSHLVGNCSSGPEFEIIEFIKSYLPDLAIHQGTRQIIGPKEIDIYIPKFNLGIEYCGLYWHNELSPTPRDFSYHYNKMKSCEERGVRLITIFEDEWNDRKKQIKNYLKSTLHIHNFKIYARKCKIKEVDSKTARIFLDNYHIQGKTHIKIAFGLYFENELLGVVTGNKHHRRQRHNKAFVLNRLVFKDGVQVVGGASRLVKKLIKYCKENNYNKLISWSDNRYSQGNVYEKCGFSLESDLNPDYCYITPEIKRESKQSNNKRNLLKKGAIGNMTNTEKELAFSLGMVRIWDCGKKRWVINLI